MARYRIEVGYDHDVQSGNIVGAIANEAGLDSKDIGRIVIHDSYSTVDLPDGMPNETLNDLKKARVVGQALRISRESSGGGSRDKRSKGGNRKDYKSNDRKPRTTKPGKSKSEDSKPGLTKAEKAAKKKKNKDKGKRRDKGKLKLMVKPQAKMKEE
ncbi:MAG TPA: hypothetical protein ENH23_05580 [candidate division Zixibacteria bacterium]|nr:hypothetical protein [candidate division Zixibacteria bacterium]